MKPAHALALALIPIASVAGTVVAAWSQKIRDLFFFLMVVLTVFSERMDVNFFSQEWYRGTTRGVQVSLVEILAFSLLAGSILSRHSGQPRRFPPASLGLMLLYLGYSCFSVIISEPKIYGVFELSKILGSILIFVAAADYSRSKREWTILVAALACAVGFEGLWSIRQRVFSHIDRVAGTLDHANSLSMYFCLATPPLVAVAYAGWSRLLRWSCAISAILASIALVLTVSRAGIPIFAFVVGGTFFACASWRITTSRIIVRTGLVVALIALAAASWSHVMRRYSEVSMEEEYFDPHIDGRGIYLRLAKAINTEHFMGVGLNNWSYYVSKTYGPRLGFNFANYDYLVSVYGPSDEVFGNSYLAAPAHNLGALTLGELGIPGLLIFTALWLRWMGMGASFLFNPKGDARRTLGVGIFFSVLGIFGQSVTEWVYRQTPILFTFYILLGALAGLIAHRRLERRQRRLVEAESRPMPELAAREPALVT